MAGFFSTVNFSKGAAQSLCLPSPNVMHSHANSEGKDKKSTKNRSNMQRDSKSARSHDLVIIPPTWISSDPLSSGFPEVFSPSASFQPKSSPFHLSSLDKVPHSFEEKLRGRPKTPSTSLPGPPGPPLRGKDITSPPLSPPLSPQGFQNLYRLSHLTEVKDRNEAKKNSPEVPPSNMPEKLERGEAPSMGEGLEPEHSVQSTLSKGKREPRTPCPEAMPPPLKNSITEPMKYPSLSVGATSWTSHQGNALSLLSISSSGTHPTSISPLEGSSGAPLGDPPSTTGFPTSWSRMSTSPHPFPEMVPIGANSVAAPNLPVCASTPTLPTAAGGGASWTNRNGSNNSSANSSLSFQTTMRNLASASSRQGNPRQLKPLLSNRSMHNSAPLPNLTNSVCAFPSRKENNANDSSGREERMETLCTGPHSRRRSLSCSSVKRDSCTGKRRLSRISSVSSESKGREENEGTEYKNAAPSQEVGLTSSPLATTEESSGKEETVTQVMNSGKIPDRAEAEIHSAIPSSAVQEGHSSTTPSTPELVLGTSVLTDRTLQNTLSDAIRSSTERLGGSGSSDNSDVSHPPSSQHTLPSKANQSPPLPSDSLTPTTEVEEKEKECIEELGKDANNSSHSGMPHLGPPPPSRVKNSYVPLMNFSIVDGIDSEEPQGRDANGKKRLSYLNGHPGNNSATVGDGSMISAVECGNLFNASEKTSKTSVPTSTPTLSITGNFDTSSIRDKMSYTYRSGTPCSIAGDRSFPPFQELSKDTLDKEGSSITEEMHRALFPPRVAEENMNDLSLSALCPPMTAARRRHTGKLFSPPHRSLGKGEGLPMDSHLVHPLQNNDNMNEVEVEFSSPQLPHTIPSPSKEFRSKTASPTLHYLLLSAQHSDTDKEGEATVLSQGLGDLVLTSTESLAGKPVSGKAHALETRKRNEIEESSRNSFLSPSSQPAVMRSPSVLTVVVPPSTRKRDAPHRTLPLKLDGKSISVQSDNISGTPLSLHSSDTKKPSVPPLQTKFAQPPRDFRDIWLGSQKPVDPIGSSVALRRNSKENLPREAAAVHTPRLNSSRKCSTNSPTKFRSRQVSTSTRNRPQVDGEYNSSRSQRRARSFGSATSEYANKSLDSSRTSSKASTRIEMGNQSAPVPCKTVEGHMDENETFATQPHSILSIADQGHPFSSADGSHFSPVLLPSTPHGVFRLSSLEREPLPVNSKGMAENRDLFAESNTSSGRSVSEKKAPSRKHSTSPLNPFSESASIRSTNIDLSAGGLNYGKSTSSSSRSMAQSTSRPHEKKVQLPSQYDNDTNKSFPERAEHLVAPTEREWDTAKNGSQSMKFTPSISSGFPGDHFIPFPASFGNENQLPQMEEEELSIRPPHTVKFLEEVNAEPVKTGCCTQFVDNLPLLRFVSTIIQVCMLLYGLVTMLLENFLWMKWDLWMGSLTEMPEPDYMGVELFIFILVSTFLFFFTKWGFFWYIQVRRSQLIEKARREIILRVNEMPLKPSLGIGPGRSGAGYSEGKMKQEEGSWALSSTSPHNSPLARRFSSRRFSYEKVLKSGHSALSGGAGHPADFRNISYVPSVSCPSTDDVDVGGAHATVDSHMKAKKEDIEVTNPNSGVEAAPSREAGSFSSVTHSTTCHNENPMMRRGKGSLESELRRRENNDAVVFMEHHEGGEIVEEDEEIQCCLDFWRNRKPKQRVNDASTRGVFHGETSDEAQCSEHVRKNEGEENQRRRHFPQGVPNDESQGKESRARELPEDQRSFYVRGERRKSNWCVIFLQSNCTVPGLICLARILCILFAVVLLLFLATSALGNLIRSIVVSPFAYAWEYSISMNSDFICSEVEFIGQCSGFETLCNEENYGNLTNALNFMCPYCPPEKQKIISTFTKTCPEVFHAKRRVMIIAYSASLVFCSFLAVLVIAIHPVALLFGAWVERYKQK